MMNLNLKKKMLSTKESILILPSPSNIHSMWSFGSMAGICLVIQITTGLFLSMHFCPQTSIAFNSIVHIMTDVDSGWFLRVIHANGSSLFFFIIYLHISRNIYFNSFNLKKVWSSGIMILFILMAVAFLGYVLPWGQMSFWGAAVITNLLSAVPYLGQFLVYWLWGGFSVNNATLNRFFSLHFILPFILTVMILIHLILLHEKGSNNPLGMNSNIDKISFHPYFTIKDFIGFSLMIFLLFMLSFCKPMWLNDPENFIPANSMVTPVHIQPEWYFLFAYAILRSIPNKLGGVMALVLSILMLMSLPLTMKNKFQSNKFYPLNKLMIWSFFFNIFILTWIGAMPVEFPYESIGWYCTIIHFSFFLTLPLITKKWDKLIS